jgi:HEAT repeat protein/uncharacterized protein (DUF697 family)/GTPase SAR1 family protein
MSVWSLLRPIKLAWGFVYRLWQRLDAGLVRLARPFGVNITDPTVQHARFVLIYVVIYLVTLLPVPVLPLVALAVGYVGIIAVGQAWVANEKQRARIAKKLVEGWPDEMPDLRWVALASALQLLLLFPLLYQQMQRHFGLYHVPDGANFWSWVAFTFDMYSQSFLGLLDLYGVHTTSIAYSSPWGRHLATVERFTLYYLLIQGITRLFAIRETVQDAVAAVTADPDMAVRIGRRAVDALIDKLRDPAPLVRRRAAEALGLLKDRSAVGPLGRALLDADAGVRAQAAEALGRVRSVGALGPLTAVLKIDRDAAVRVKAVAALGELGDPDAGPALADRLRDDRNEAVVLEAVQALARLGGEESRRLLLEALHDAQPRAVVLRINDLLGMGERDLLVDAHLVNLARPQADGFLSSVVKWVRPGGRKVDSRALDLDVRKRQHAVESLGALGCVRAVAPLLLVLQDRGEESEVRAAAAEALGKLGDLRAVEGLRRAATDRKEKWGVREQARAALLQLAAPAPSGTNTSGSALSLGEVAAGVRDGSQGGARSCPPSPTTAGAVPCGSRLGNNSDTRFGEQDSSMHDKIDIGALAKEKLREALRERGHVNVLIAGRTGVGKSTLINSVFQGQLATTGQGKPVTQNTREITKGDIPLSIFDTRGLEMADFDSTKQALRAFVSDRSKEPDARKHVHVGWVCISEDLRRVERAEEELTKMLAEFMPVVVIITKARADQNFRATVQSLLPYARNVVRVRAIREELDDGHALPQLGLQDLIDLTMEVVPEGQRRAFTAAQKVDIALKKKQSHLIVTGAAASAAAVGLTPIPFADAALLVPIQVGMLAGITATFGLSFNEGFLASLVGSVITGTGATMAGRAIVGGLLKLIPGVGSVVGGAISGATAAAITTAFGEAYIASLVALFKHGGEAPTAAEVLEKFKREYGQRS